MKRKINYLNNRDILHEIHLSKISYCEYEDFKYTNFDVIVEDPSAITIDTFKNGVEGMAARISADSYRESLTAYNKGIISDKPKLADFKIDPYTLNWEDVIVRAMTYEHIPSDLKRKKSHRRTADKHKSVNFIPFKHYIYSPSNYTVTINDVPLKEVVRSHSKDGKFSKTHGAITDNLAKMFLLLVDRYSEKPNWRGYSYLDEMKGQSLLQLIHLGLQFNEAKSDNPFSYYTQFLSNSFTRVLNIEKRNQNIRDDLLEEAGQSPSFTRQIDSEEAVRKLRDEIDDDKSI